MKLDIPKLARGIAVSVFSLAALAGGSTLISTSSAVSVLQDQHTAAVAQRLEDVDRLKRIEDKVDQLLQRGHDDQSYRK